MKKILGLLLCAILSMQAFAISPFKPKTIPVSSLRTRLFSRLEKFRQKYSFKTRKQYPPSKPSKPGFPGTAQEVFATSQRFIPRTIYGPNNQKVLSYNQPVLAPEHIQDLGGILQRSRGGRRVLMYNSVTHDPRLSELDQLVLFSHYLYEEGQPSALFRYFFTRRLNTEVTELVGVLKSEIAVLDLSDGVMFTLRPGDPVAVSNETAFKIIKQTSEYNISQAQEDTWSVPSKFLPQLEEIALRSTQERSFLLPEGLEELITSGLFGEPQAGIYAGGYSALMVQLPEELTVFDGQKLITLEAGSYLQLPQAQPLSEPVKGIIFPSPKAHIYNITPQHRVVEDFTEPQQFFTGNKKGAVL